MTTDGDASLEGYYIEEDRPLALDERLRFARDEDAGARFLHRVERLVGMQHHRDAAEALGLAAGGSTEAFACVLAAMARGQGDAVAVSVDDGGAARVAQQGPRLLLAPICQGPSCTERRGNLTPRRKPKPCQSAHPKRSCSISAASWSTSTSVEPSRSGRGIPSCPWRTCDRDSSSMRPTSSTSAG
jgi:hypothetical protein